MPTGRRHEINIRLAIGSTLCGLGRDGVMKLLGALNLPPPIQEHKYREAQEFVLDYIEKAQEQSMATAVEEAVAAAGGVRDLVVSGDGAWLTRGYSSLHGIAALCSTTANPKVIDTTWSSKNCSKCLGAESLRHTNFDLFSTFQENHECQLNFTGTFYELYTNLLFIISLSNTGASGAMEKLMIHEMFCRSLSKYKIKYISYVGDGDAKVHNFLTNNPPYSGVTIKKLEDTNHFAKRMLSRIKKIKQESKGKTLSDGKRFSGKGRMTDAHAIKFKIYFAKAIRESKTDLDKLYKKSWAIFNHHYSTDREPMHDWCDSQWCKYLQADLKGEQYQHNSKLAIPRACLDLIKPAFEELCSPTSLARVIGGGSQNANEAFHSLLWTMVPKHRFCSTTILRIGLGLSTIIYNDGYDSLDKLFTNVFSSAGYYSVECFSRLGMMRKYATSKVKKRRQKSKTTPVTITTAASANSSSSGSDDDEIPFIHPNTNSVNLTQDLMDLQLTDDESNSDYEPGGDY
ncbi:unnamed protein product [Rotaria socialis]|nr:unnamed protein product [Rotaria socialis]